MRLRRIPDEEPEKPPKVEAAKRRPYPKNRRKANQKFPATPLSDEELAYFAEHMNACLAHDATESFLGYLDQAGRKYSAPRIAEQIGTSRRGIYKLISKDGNPELKNLMGVLRVLGLQLRIVPAPGVSRRFWLSDCGLRVQFDQDELLPEEIEALSWPGNTAFPG